MARIASALKLGYYPLPEEHGPSIRERLRFPSPKTPATALDPCAGIGVALQAITANSGARLYAVELDADRAEAAEQAGITTIHGSAFDVRGKAGQLSLLYLNPPYDFEIGAYANKRMEALFLKRTYGWLRPKGVLVMVVPGRAIPEMRDTLAARFENVRIYRMEGELSEKYDQYAVFGVRHNNNAKAESLLSRQLTDAMWRTDSLPMLTTEADTVYAVPPGGEVQFTYRGMPLDAIEDMLPSSAAWRHAAPMLLPRADIVGGRPLTPLHGGHVGLLATAGMLNGVFGSGKDRHLARWRAVKHSLTTTERKDGLVVERTVERFANELALVFVSGKTQILTETKPASNEPEGGTEAKPTHLDLTADEDEEPRTVECEVRCESEPSFELGRIALSDGVHRLIAEHQLSFTKLLSRYASRDWGEDANRRDRLANEEAIEYGNREILASYLIPEAPEGKVWIITSPDHSVTTILLPEEYPNAVRASRSQPGMAA